MPSHTEQDAPMPWSAFLDELDQAISVPIELHCIGAFVVSLLYGLPRPTGDVDFTRAVALSRWSYSRTRRFPNKMSALS
jgi:hypothetical protein